MARGKAGSEDKASDPKSTGAKKASAKESAKKSAAFKEPAEESRKAASSAAKKPASKKENAGQASEPGSSSRSAINPSKATEPEAASALQSAEKTSSEQPAPAGSSFTQKAAPVEHKPDSKTGGSAKSGEEPHPDVSEPPKAAAAAAAVSAAVAQPVPPADSSSADATSAEPNAGPPDELDGILLPASGGKATVFGGPKDRSLKPDDKLGLPTGPHFQYERARTLNPKAYYCQMRWEYRQKHMSTEEGKRWWANKKLLVSGSNGSAVVVKAVDFGPHEDTGLVIGISPAAAEAIGIGPGQEVNIKFADQKAPLGPVGSE